MEEKLDFYEAYRIVDGTNRKIRYDGSIWFELVNNSKRGLIKTVWLWSPITTQWWPTPEQAKEKVWEVEPEEIYVWGRCDKNGNSKICNPHHFHKEFNKPELNLLSKNLFPKEMKNKKINIRVDSEINDFWENFNFPYTKSSYIADLIINSDEFKNKNYLSKKLSNKLKYKKLKLKYFIGISVSLDVIQFWKKFNSTEGKNMWIRNLIRESLEFKNYQKGTI